MDCEEFLRQFREALEGKVSESIIQDNMNYYRSYINSQAAGGKSESEVMKMLGDPRLLAKTIEESHKFASENQSGRSGYGDSNGYYSSAETNNNDYTKNEQQKRFKFPRWLLTGIVMIAVMLVILIVFRVFVFLSPVIIVLLIGGFFVRMLGGWWKGE